MRVLHIGKYYSPFEGGIENFLSGFLKNVSKLSGSSESPNQKTSHFVLAHHHQLWSSTSVERFEETSVLRSFILCRFLFTPVAPFFYRHLKQSIQKFQPDIIHVHLPNPSAFWLLMLHNTDIPIVIHWHADVVSSEKNRLLSLAYFFYEKLEKKLLARAKAIIVTSAPYLDISTPLAPWKNKCHIVPLGLDACVTQTSTTSESSLFWQQKNSFKILCIGRLTYYKGHEFLIKAVSEMQNTELVIVGTGNLMNKYRRLVESQNLQDKVHLTGHASADQLHLLLEECNCLCLPSIERTEAFGLVLLEAMQHAKPCITTSVTGSGMNWVVKDGITGLVVPPEDSESLKNALIQLQENPALSEQLGKAGKSRLESHFSLSQVSNKISAVYNSVLTQ